VLTYAEVHYRPRFVPSLIYMKQPEIVCDAPTRIDPGRPIPVFIFVKDANRFPVVITEVVVHAVYENGAERVARFPFENRELQEPLWWDSINIIPEFTGLVKLLPYVVVKKGKRLLSIPVDNYRDSTKSPLLVYASTESLPGGDGWYHGDIHCHTYYTSDQVEFGAPVEAMALAGSSMGLDWMAATDHSYDLDDRIDDYLAREPLLLKWRILKRVSSLLQNTFTVIPGEEITCRTQSGRNCHMLALNADRFIYGSGDSGEIAFKTRSECSIGEAVASCLEWGGITCAAHPMEYIPLLEKLILRRGEWTLADLKNTGLQAMQIHNGVRDSGFQRGMEAWISLLLDGYRLYAFGGSDAHGDMNRRRRVGFPFFSIAESMNHTFGCVRTVVRSRTKKKDDICAALKEGHAVVTGGPFIDLNVSVKGNTGGPGDEITTGRLKIQASFHSSREFGSLKNGRIYAGVSGESSERVVFSLEHFDSEYEHICEDTCEGDRFMYIRAECETASNKLCFTNPVWVR